MAHLLTTGNAGQASGQTVVIVGTDGHSCPLSISDVLEGPSQKAPESLHSIF